MYEYPVKYFEDNLVFNTSRNECWAYYKMDGFNYDFKSNENKISILNSLSRFLSNIGIEAKILVVPVSQDIDKHFQSLTSQLNKKDSLYEFSIKHSEGTKVYLKEKIRINGNSNDYKVYVGTKLRLSTSILRDLKDLLSYLIKEPTNAIMEALGAEAREIFKREKDMFVNLASEYLKKQTKRIRIKPCESSDIEWLTRRAFKRGLTGSIPMRSREGHPWSPFSERIIKNGEVAIRAHTKDILTLTEGELDTTESRVLKVHQDDGTVSYQSFMALSFIPDGIEFPGNEWLFVLQDLPIQTEICIHIDTLEHNESLKAIGKKKREIQDQIDHINENNDDLPDELAFSKEHANQLESELKATRAPITMASIVFCIAADTKEELEDRVSFIKEFYTDHNFIIERPASDQLKLFMEFLPGTGRYVADYVMRIPPRTLAGGMIGATRLLGDNIGPYIGTTGILRKNVYLDKSRACRLNRSAAAAFLGTLGGGKSFNANLLFYLSVIYGAYGLVIDPKGERSNWVHDLPELKGQINIITLSSNEKDKGKLDPFLIYKNNLEDAGYLAISILSELFKLDPKDDEYMVILEAIDWVKTQEKPCMIKLAQRLIEFPQEDEFCQTARKVGRRIKLLRNMAMSGLLFGNGDEDALSFESKISVLQIENLSMPKPDKPKKDYTQEEVISTVLMLPIASFARKFMHMNRQIYKEILFDEAWALSANSQGEQMIDTLIREGRALNAGCSFIGHSTRDMKGEGIKNNITYKFCFKATEINEIKRILEFLDLECTDENISRIRNLENGQCLFQDLDGRVGDLKFDAVYEHLERAFDTRPNVIREEEGEAVETPA